MDGYETRPFLMDSIKGGNFIGFCELFKMGWLKSFESIMDDAEMSWVISTEEKHFLKC
jgi:hypothetical protein